MKNIKRNIVIVALLLVFLLGGLLIGGKYGASNNWSSELSNFAAIQLNSAGLKKTTQLLENTDITSQMKHALSPEIEAQERELERLLEEYYQLKISGLTGSADYKALEAKIKSLKNTMLARYKEEIDKSFASQK